MSTTSSTSTQPVLPTSPPPQLKPVQNPSPQNEQQQQQQTPPNLTTAVVPALNRLYELQNALNAKFSPDSIQDMLFHTFKYPTQTTFGLMIGQFKNDRLHIVEAVPISHTTQISPTILESCLEITNLRISRTSSLNSFKEEMASSTTAAPLHGGNPSTTGFGPGGQGHTMNTFMGSIEDFIKNEEKKLQEHQQQQLQQQQQFEQTGAPNIFQQTQEGQAQFVANLPDESHNSDDQFICGMYICPTPAPKINASVLTVLADPSTPTSQQLYQTAAQMQLHSALKTIPYIFLKFFYDLTMQCPNPVLTIIDPILLNINTEAYNQYDTIKTQYDMVKASGNTTLLAKFTPEQITVVSHPFQSPLPTLTTYFLHDDVLMEVTSEDLMGDKPIVDLLFLDRILSVDRDDAANDKSKPTTTISALLQTATPDRINLTIDQLERPNYPTTTRIDPLVWGNIMKEVKNRAYFTLIDWQETLSD